MPLCTEGWNSVQEGLGITFGTAAGAATAVLVVTLGSDSKAISNLKTFFPSADNIRIASVSSESVEQQITSPV